MSKSVYLSPSTQEKNIGVDGYKSEEFRMNQIADIVEKTLKQHNVIIYRNKPNMTLYDVVRDSNFKKPDIHVPIHSNAFDKKSRGCEIFCYKKLSTSRGFNLAKELYKNLEKITPTSDRGIKEGYNFYGTKKHMYEVAYTKCPAALIEIAFHDNKEDAKWIMENIPEIGESISKGILSYFKIPFNEKETESKLPEFPVTEEAKAILQKNSKHSNDWITFFEKNTHINLSGLIEILNYKFVEAESNYLALMKSTKDKNIIMEKTINELIKKTNELQELIKKLSSQDIFK